MHFNSSKLVLKLAGSYAVFAAGWILLSDWMLSLLPLDTEQLTLLQSYKGVFFVVITTGLLAFVLRRLLLRWKDEADARLASSDKVRLLSRETERLRTALNEHAIVAITDPQGRITYVNDKFCEISQYSRDELLGRDHRLINSGLHSKEFMREMWVTIGNGHTWQGEIRNQAKDGSFYWVNTTIVPFLNETGRPSQYVSIRTDITNRKRVEEALGESERRFRELLENVDLLAVTIDRTGAITFCNHCLLRAGGWKREEVVGRDWFAKFVPPEASAAARKLFADDIEAGGPPRHHESPLLVREGERREVAWSSVVLRDAAGRVTGMASIGEDVTNRKRDDKARQLFRALVDQSNDIVEIIDPVTARYIDVSENGPASLGCTRTEFLGRRLFDIESTVTEADWPQVVAQMRQTGGLRREGRHQRADGTAFPVEVNAKLVRLDREYVLAVVRDVTERKRAEEALVSERTLLRTLFDLLPDYIYVKDTDSRFLACNERCMRGMNAATPEEIIGKTDADFYPRDVAAGFRADELEVLAGKPVLNKEEQVRQPDGKIRYILTTKLPRRDASGKIIGIVGTGRDITERKLLDEKFLRVQRLEAIGTLAGGVAHDLNNILAPVLMAAGLLKDKLHEEHDREILGMVEQGAQRGASIIGQLLTFSRGVEGARVSVQLRHLLKEMVQMMGETFPRNIRIEPKVSPELWNVVADATQLHQVLMNLCVNARDAMPTGGKLTIELSNINLDEAAAQAQPKVRPGPHVLLAVTDTGHGIPSEIAHRIFDPFFTTKGVGKGTGLGLSTVLGIVKSHGGFMTVYSEPKQGTCFKVYLPAEIGAPVAVTSQAGPPIPTGHNEMVLVVDDEALICEMVRRTLTRYGYQVITAGNGGEAIRLFIQHQGAVQLVMTDVMMPVMGGVELVQSLRVLKPALRIVAFSGLDQDDRREALVALGVAEILGKPFSTEELLKCVSRVLPGAVHAPAAT